MTSLRAILLLPLLAPASAVERFVLSNGVPVIRVEAPPSAFSLQLFLRAGSAEEPAGEEGVHNLLQRVLFKGTERLSSERFAAALEELGLSYGAEAQEDFLSAYLYGLSEVFPEGLALFYEGITRPAFPAEEVERERAAVIQEILSRHDTIFPTAEDLFRSLFYPGDPYGRLLAGTTGSVSRLDRRDLEDAYQRIYRPQRMTFVYAGPLSTAALREHLDPTFGSLEAPEEKPAGPPPPARIASSPRRKIQPARFGQAMLMLGFPAPAASSEDLARTKVFAAALGGGMSSRLFRELREVRPFAYEVGAYLPTQARGSHLVGYLGLKPENLKEAEEVLVAAFRRMETVTEEEAARARNYVIGAYRISRQTAYERARWAGFWEMMGRGAEYLDQYDRDLAAVTAEDLRKIARSLPKTPLATALVRPLR